MNALTSNMIESILKIDTKLNKIQEDMEKETDYERRITLGKSHCVLKVNKQNLAVRLNQLVNKL